MKKYQLKRAIRRLCGITATISFLFALGVAGGIEKDMIDVLPGAVAGTALMGSCGLFAWLAGAFEPEPQRRRV